MQLDHIAVQLYTLRTLTAQDMLGTLRHVAAIGYRAVEFAGYGGVPTPAIRATLDEQGIHAVAAHVSLDQLATNFDGVLTDMQTLGCQYVVVPWSGEMYRGSTVQVRELVNLLNSYGQRFADAGLRLAYHNHQFEFAPLDGSTMWELLAAETDPALVDLELDVFWAEVGGFDPIDLIGRYSARLPLLHLKDRAHGPDNTDLPVGAGVLPWERILAAADAAGVQWGIVEQDHPGDPLDDIRRSFHYLQTQCAA